MSILRRRFVYKSLAIFFLLEFVLNIITPTISWALTSGPTMPETTSFEPVDTTDLVNLNTGDLTYNIPLLDIPDPSGGGYPLSLSYHAGIMTEEEASWVGLGWTLNPGSITRNVNGYPDDFKNVSTFDHVFWEGGKQETYSVGLSVGVYGIVGVSAGIAISNDTYKGIGVGGNLGLTFGKNESPYSGAVGVSFNPYGGVNAYASAGVGINLGKGVSTSISASTNFTSVSFSASASYVKSLGASIAISPKSGILGSSLSIGSGTASINNNKSDEISIDNRSFSTEIPILPGVNLSLGYSYLRYWIDQTEIVGISGAIHNPTAYTSDFDNKAFDSYTLPVSNSSTDPSLSSGPSYFNTDDYNVNVQGLAGKLKPFHFKNILFKQNKKKENNYILKQYPYSSDDYPSGKTEFRFLSAFSNYYKSEDENWNSSIGPLKVVKGNHQSGLTGNDGLIGNKLLTSRDIQWYTNKEILENKPVGFIDCIAAGFIRSKIGVMAEQIGGFKITNENGMTYHFSLPAYAYDEYQFSENIDQSGGQYYNELKKPSKYAYTWYLTAITGPDYVDRGPDGLSAPDGKLNENDFGYWISFEYGKWTESYVWRNPNTGYDVDLDNNFRNYSSGKKEIYYLNSIASKSHCALFFKSMRHDSKGICYTSDMPRKRDLGFVPSYYNNREEPPGDFYSINHFAYPTPTLKLDKIVLYEKKYLNNLLSNSNINNLSELYNKGDGLKVTVNYPRTPFNVGGLEIFQLERTESQTLYDFKNILDDQDVVPLLDPLKSITLKEIRFVHSYKLCSETPNSISNLNLYSSNPPTNESSLILDGKLSLEVLKILGKEGKQLLPDYNFFYEIENPLEGTGTITTESNRLNLSSSNSGLIEGDIIMFNSTSGVVYALVVSVLGEIHHLKVLGKNYPNIGTCKWKTTKNPPYKKDHFDMWGLYKPDYDLTLGEDLSRITTSISSKSCDVWSLRSVLTPNGAKIKFEYEPDKYSNAVFQTGHAFVVKSLQRINCSESTNNPRIYEDDVPIPTTPQIIDPATIECVFRLNIYNEGVDLRKLYKVNTGVPCVLPYSYTTYYDGYSSAQHTYATNILATSVGQDYIEGKVYLKEGSTLYGASVFHYFNEQSEFPGGYRVKSVATFDGVNQSYNKTSYDYLFNGVSSGVTSYEPNVFDKINVRGASKELKSNSIAAVRAFTSVSNLLMFARELPSPGVMYKYVKVNEEVIDKNSKVNILKNSSLYEFEVVKKEMIGINSVNLGSQSSGAYDNISYSSVKKEKFVLYDFTSSIGSLLANTIFDSEGRIIKKTLYNYLHQSLITESTSIVNLASRYENEMLKFNNQGITHETTWDGKFVKTGTNYQLLGVISKRQVYPKVILSEETFDSKTGITTKTSNLAYDFYTGQVIKSKINDGFNNVFITETTPAYTVPNYKTGMGLIAFGGKNMLTQEAYSITYKVDPNNFNERIGLVSASAQTWSNQIKSIEPGQSYSSATAQAGIWRKHANYSFVGDDNDVLQSDGLMPLTGSVEFNSWNKDDSTPLNWQKNSEITLYDVNSHALEAKDLNNLHATTKFSFDQSQVLTTATNAEYREIAFTSAEEVPQIDQFNTPSFGGNIYFSGTRTSDLAHTGSYSIKANANTPAFTYSFVPNLKTYIVNYWTSHENASSVYCQIDSSSPVSVNTRKIGSAGNWHLMEASITINENADRLKIWCQSNVSNTYFDDFRVVPKDATITSYVYNNWGELSHILNDNHLYTKFQYDDMGRLESTYKETLNPVYGIQGIVKVSEVKYNYGRNNKNTVDFTISKTGPSGSVSPFGVVPVDLDGAKTISFISDCPNINTLEKVLIDGKVYSYSLTPRTITLPSGTEVSIQGGSVTFKKISASHKVEGVFGPFNYTPPSVPGSVSCVTDNNGCFTGQYSYLYYDECGQAGPIQVGYSVPNDLAHLIDASSCRNVAGSGCPEY
ncbi:MAG: hypothetical protein O9302_09410 [Cyclobacteriaceae bacterium]|nr:hypothetical protein [Cytophagales bacterium]MCZ8328262.1 hypothetical protein [Cyclobacteriaceae bacterium]